MLLKNAELNFVQGSSFVPREFFRDVAMIVNIFAVFENSLVHKPREKYRNLRSRHFLFYFFLLPFHAHLSETKSPKVAHSIKERKQMCEKKNDYNH